MPHKLILISVFLLGLMSGTSVNAQYSPSVGEPHPNLTLPRIGDRRAVSLADFRGKKLLLIHFASW